MEEIGRSGTGQLSSKHSSWLTTNARKWMPASGQRPTVCASLQRRPQSGEGFHCPDTLLIALVVITPNKWDGPHHLKSGSHKTQLPDTHSHKVSQSFLVSNYIFLKELSHCKQLCCGKGRLPSEVVCAVYDCRLPMRRSIYHW